MAWSALGDSAWLFEAGGATPGGRLAEALALARHLEANRIPEITDVVSSFDSVAVHFDPSHGERVFDWLTGVPPPAFDTADLPEGRLLEVPVAYGGEYGPDLGPVARELGRRGAEIVRLHSAAEYRVAAIGFAPGFPYLLGLPESLCLPRRSNPRPVAAGSVAIAGNQAGVYPFASQGGWHVLGRTARPLFDPLLPEPSRLRPGDRVRFVPVKRLEPSQVDIPAPESREGAVVVLKPGAFTTVQDLGRQGFQSQGVSPGGAADPVAAAVVNRLVGNPDNAALLECCMSGPLLKFYKAARIAWLGWEDSQSGRPVDVAEGGRVDLRGPLRGVRGYLAISGGIDVPVVLGSRATDVRAGFGGLHGRLLRTGDWISIGPPGKGPKPGNWWVRFPYESAPCQLLELRFLPGRHGGTFDAAAWACFRGETFRVSAVSNRMGARLEGPVLQIGQAEDMLSQPVVAGSVQVPPSGVPIVLLAERQTIGGYPQIAQVISADLPKLARAWPGTPIRFREVSMDEAREAWADRHRDLGFLQARIDLLR